ncbi:MAG: Potassium efflux system KefA protein / Small-conductance mechanosensitive channel [Pseudomonadota bacterium]|nr:Potassium efflux system KefA protein / Small-conductance mechanosensitive channel [Pseudomonadota bacterium]
METSIDQFIQHISTNPFYQACLILIGGLLIAKLVNIIISQVVLRITRQTPSDLDDKIVHVLRPALFYSIQLVALALALDLVLPAHGYWPSLILKSLAVVLWMVFFVRTVKIVLRTFSNEQRTPLINAQTLPLFENFGIMVVLGAATYAFFSIWGIDMTAWLASAGIVGIAVGFAAKDTLANLFSGALIIADAPYQIGDVIVLESGERGEVTHIGIRSTRIQTLTDVEITVPNAIMGNTKIINESGGPSKKTGVMVSVGVAYGSDIDKVKKILLDEAAANNEVCREPAPSVRLRQFGASSLDIDLWFWITDPLQRGRMTDALNTSIYKRFQAENIEIPYSKQDVFIKELPVQK